MLKVKKSDKPKYLQYIYEKDLGYIRNVIILSCFFYAIFGVLDYILYKDYISQFYLIRFTFVIPSFLVAYFLSFRKNFKSYYQIVLLVIFIIGATGIIMMINLIEEYNYYFPGLYLVFSVAFFMLRLRPKYTSIGVLFVIVIFVITGLVYGHMSTTELFAETFFYVSTAIISIFGSLYQEQYRIQNYYHQSLLKGENVVLETKLFKHYEEVKNYHSATIIALARLAESRDIFTGGHIKRVGVLAEKLAKEIPDSIYISNNLDKETFVDTINLASSLHDIGKIAISDVILNKPGKLTKDEFDIMKTHTTKGYEMLLSIQEDYEENDFINLGIQISKSHHERWDGTGYPEGLKEEEIPLSARIMAIVDVYDALISERPYKKAFSTEKSISIIKEGIGTHFDPKIANIFIGILE